MVLKTFATTSPSINPASSLSSIVEKGAITDGPNCLPSCDLVKMTLSAVLNWYRTCATKNTCASKPSMKSAKRAEIYAEVAKEANLKEFPMPHLLTDDGQDECNTTEEYSSDSSVPFENPTLSDAETELPTLD